MKNQPFMHDILHRLQHHLPSQSPLKDFIHHNTLHAFQHYPFFQGIEAASQMLGAKTLLSLGEYRQLYAQEKISDRIIDKVVLKYYSPDDLNLWREKMMVVFYHEERKSNIGQLRKLWKQHYHVDLDLLIQPTLFRTVCNYLDQGIAIWNFPINKDGLLATIREFEKKSMVHFFASPRVKQLLFSKDCNLSNLLHILVGDETYYEQYLFDQQFSHQGWSGMVATVESMPQTLLDKRKISLEEFIIFECLLEIDALDQKFGAIWQPLTMHVQTKPIQVWNDFKSTELFKVLRLWQESYEWTFYDQVLSGIQQYHVEDKQSKQVSFQGVFCIDDRECSFRRYLESIDSQCETFGTPGFFGVEFYFQPEDGKYTTKVCPAPITPKYVIKERNRKTINKKDVHFHKNSHQLLLGWLIAQTLGLVAALRLAWNIFIPSMSPATSYSFRHMDKQSDLTIENENNEHDEHGLQVGFTVEEMAIRVENMLRSIGLNRNFADLVYIVGHGSTSVNNTYYAGYDCGACSGRPGSVNARVFAFMANHEKVRDLLKKRGIEIPASSKFIGALRDTSRDTIVFYDVQKLDASYQSKHTINEQHFFKASDLNSKERSRRFDSMDTTANERSTHEAVKIRSVSLFEPRPEYNHATNTLCVVGSRALTKNLFLDRRSFLNSYDYRVDPEGKYLLNILNAVAPVCGGINLEYFFSRVDNQKFGAGTKLAHNVMGLIGVANGIDGDLRPGLPSQMIEIHDPLRLLVIVEHYPEVVLDVIQKNPATYEWFKNQWIHLVTFHPDNKEMYYFENENFGLYHVTNKKIQRVMNLKKLIERNNGNIPVQYLKEEFV